MVTDRLFRRLRKLLQTEDHPGQRRRQGGPRREDGAQVPRLGPAPQSTADPPHLADPGGPVPGRLARTPGEAPAQPRAPGQDPVCRPATAVPGPLRRRATADLAAADQAVAGPRGAGQGGVLRPGPSPRPALLPATSRTGRPGRDHRRRAVRPPDLPLRADLLQLGDGHGLLLGELGEPQRRACRTPCGNWAACPAAPHRSADGGDQADSDTETFTQRYQALLRHYGLQGQAIQPRQGQRERRRRAEPPPVQAGRGPGPDAARQPGLRQPRRRTRRSCSKVWPGSNANRKERFAEELAVLRPLPARRLEMGRAGAGAGGRRAARSTSAATSTRCPAG